MATQVVKCREKLRGFRCETCQDVINLLSFKYGEKKQIDVIVVEHDLFSRHIWFEYPFISQ